MMELVQTEPLADCFEGWMTNQENGQALCVRVYDDRTSMAVSFSVWGPQGDPGPHTILTLPPEALGQMRAVLTALGLPVQPEPVDNEPNFAEAEEH